LENGESLDTGVERKCQEDEPAYGSGGMALQRIARAGHPTLHALGWDFTRASFRYRPQFTEAKRVTLGLIPVLLKDS
jgi:hypothetical protein